jgi:ribonuclease J
VATGTQGEDGAALARLARGEHPALDLSLGDVVIMSSRAIPGNELDVTRVIGDLLRRGVDVRTWWSDRAVHVSGHAHRDDQRRMIELVMPRGFIPVHGTLHHLSRHAALARELRTTEVCVIENGDVAEVDGDGIRKSGRVRTGRVHVFARRTLPDSVLHTRSGLACRGGAHVVVRVDALGRLAGEIVLVTQGVLDDERDAELLTAARRAACSAVEGLSGKTPDMARDTESAPDAEIAEAARLAVRHAFGRVLGFKPITTATVLREPR